MLNTIIENLRYHLYHVSNVYGMTSEQTLHFSEELEKFINLFNRRNSKTYTNQYKDTNVHSNAILNIVDVSAKEKFEIPSFFFDAAIQKADAWHHIDLVTCLLYLIEKKYGTEAVEYIGQHVPTKCIFPESVQSFSDSIKNLDQTFRLNHKSNTYIGQYLPYMDIKNEIQLFCHTPHYPTPFNYGIIKGLATKFNQSVKLYVVDKEDGGQFKLVV